MIVKLEKFALALTLAAFLVFVSLYASDKQQIDSAYAQLVKDGMPSSFSALLVKPPVDPSENAAPLYLQIFSLMESKPIAPLSDFYGYTNGNFSTWSEAKAAEAKKILNSKDFEKIDILFHEAANKKTVVFERVYDGLNTEMPELNKIRAMTRLMSTRSTSLALAGRQDELWRLEADKLKCIQSFYKDPFVISQLINIACIAITVDQYDNLLASGISEKDALMMMGLIEKLDCKRALLTALDSESLVCREYMNGDHQSKKFKADMGLIYGENKMPAEAVMDKDYLFYLTQFQSFRKLMLLPYWKAAPSLLLLKSNLKKVDKELLLSASYLGLAYDVKLKEARIQSEIDASRLKMALYVWKARHGSFPDKLEQLSPEIIKELPLDSINGKPFTYAKKDKTFTISSEWLLERQKKYP